MTADARLRAITNSRKMTILNFHRVSDKGSWGYAAMRPALFDELASWLKKRFFLTLFRDLKTLQQGGKPPLI